MKRLKARLYEILQVVSKNDPIGRKINVFIIGLITLNVIAVILETVEGFSSRYQSYFNVFEVISVVIFTIEYFLRIWVCTMNNLYRKPLSGRIRFILSPMVLVDLLAIMPFYLPFFVNFDLRSIRALRLLRFFRLFKIGRYTDSLKIMGNVIRSKREELVIMLLIVLILLVIASTLMYHLENQVQPEVFSSIPATMWWGVITFSTVGYGDIYPITLAGRILGGVIAILGIGMFALPAGILASGFSEEFTKSKERALSCPHCGQKIH